MVENDECKVNNLPKSLWNHEGTLHNNSLLMCGGFLRRRTCYQIKHGDKEWKEMPEMIEGRHYFGMAFVGQIGTIATGGIRSPDSKTVEVYNKNTWKK